jgi:hypothetical protein
MRDTFDFMDDANRGRSRFGDSESRRETQSRSDSISLSLMLQQDRPLALMVTDPTKPGSKWISLPKEIIEYDIKSPGIVVVTISEELAKEKGLA